VRRSLVLLQRSNVLQAGQARLVPVSAKKVWKLIMLPPGLVMLAPRLLRAVSCGLRDRFG
jgi:hypothetical protein